MEGKLFFLMLIFEDQWFPIVVFFYCVNFNTIKWLCWISPWPSSSPATVANDSLFRWWFHWSVVACDTETNLREECSQPVFFQGGYPLYVVSFSEFQ